MRPLNEYIEWEENSAVACIGGARVPAPLRSDAKVPLRSSLCDINNIVELKSVQPYMQSMQFA